MCRSTPNLIDVMLSKAKHLAFSSCYKAEILRLSLRNDIATQSLEEEDVCKFGVNEKFSYYSSCHYSRTE